MSTLSTTRVTSEDCSSDRRYDADGIAWGEDRPDPEITTDFDQDG